jgi:hypothetical protein
MATVKETLGKVVVLDLGQMTTKSDGWNGQTLVCENLRVDISNQELEDWIHDVGENSNSPKVRIQAKLRAMTYEQAKRITQDVISWEWVAARRPNRTRVKDVTEMSKAEILALLKRAKEEGIELPEDDPEDPENP